MTNLKEGYSQLQSSLKELEKSQINLRKIQDLYNRLELITQKQLKLQICQRADIGKTETETSKINSKIEKKAPTKDLVQNPKLIFKNKNKITKSTENIKQHKLKQDKVINIEPLKLDDLEKRLTLYHQFNDTITKSSFHKRRFQNNLEKLNTNFWKVHVLNDPIILKLEMYMQSQIK